MKRERFLFPLVCVLLLGFCNCQYASSNCSIGNYNLLPLQYDPSFPAPSGYSFSNQTTADTISINFCAQVSSQTGCTSSTSTNPPIQSPGSCQSFPGNTVSPAVIGDATTAEFSYLYRPISGNFIFEYFIIMYQLKSNAVNGFTFSDGVVLTYSGGTFCQKFNVDRSTQILVVCPPNGFPQSLTEQIYSTNEPGNCVYQVVFVSKYGCGNFVASSCSYGEFDLLPLQYNPNFSPYPGYSFYNSQSGGTIAINFCAQVASTTGCSKHATGSCQTAGGTSQTIGDASKALFSPLLEPIEGICSLNSFAIYFSLSNKISANGVNFTQGVILTYYGGALCQTLNVNSSTEIVVVCPPAGFTGVTEQIYSTLEYDCLYQVIFVSQYGCETQFYVAPTCSYANWNLLPLQYNPSASPPPGYSYYNSQSGDTVAINFCAQVAPSTGCNGTTSSSPVVDAPGGCQLLNQVPHVTGDATKVLFSPFIGPVTGYFSFSTIHCISFS